jgi:hypothetical protein
MVLAIGQGLQREYRVLEQPVHGRLAALLKKLQDCVLTECETYGQSRLPDLRVQSKGQHVRGSEHLD